MVGAVAAAVDEREQQLHDHFAPGYTTMTNSKACMRTRELPWPGYKPGEASELRNREGEVFDEGESVCHRRMSHRMLVHARLVACLLLIILVDWPR